MRREFNFKMLLLFSLTFVIGFISFEFIYPVFSPKEVSNNSSLKDVKELKEKILDCVPVDGNLKYQHIEKSQKSKDIRKKEKVAEKKADNLIKLRSEYIESLTKKMDLERKLIKSKSLSKAAKEKLRKEIAELDEKVDELSKTLYYYKSDNSKIDLKKNLLYREICKETK